MIDFFASDVFLLVIAPSAGIILCVLVFLLALKLGKKRSAQVRVTEKCKRRAYKRFIVAFDKSGRNFVYGEQ